MSMSHGSSELSDTVVTAKLKSSCGMVLKYAASSSDCWREPGVSGPFDIVQGGSEAGISTIFGYLLEP